MPDVALMAFGETPVNDFYKHHAPMELKTAKFGSRIILRAYPGFQEAPHDEYSRRRDHFSP